MKRVYGGKRRDSSNGVCSGEATPTSQPASMSLSLDEAHTLSHTRTHARGANTQGARSAESTPQLDVLALAAGSTIAAEDESEEDSRPQPRARTGLTPKPAACVSSASALLTAGSAKAILDDMLYHLDALEAAQRQDAVCRSSLVAMAKLLVLEDGIRVARQHGVVTRLLAVADAWVDEYVDTNGGHGGSRKKPRMASTSLQHNAPAGTVTAPDLALLHGILAVLCIISASQPVRDGSPEASVKLCVLLLTTGCKDEMLGLERRLRAICMAHEPASTSTGNPEATVDAWMSRANELSLERSGSQAATACPARSAPLRSMLLGHGASAEGCAPRLDRETAMPPFDAVMKLSPELASLDCVDAVLHLLKRNLQLADEDDDAAAGGVERVALTAVMGRLRESRYTLRAYMDGAGVVALSLLMVAHSTILHEWLVAQDVVPVTTASRHHGSCPPRYAKSWNRISDMLRIVEDACFLDLECVDAILLQRVPLPPWVSCEREDGAHANVGSGAHVIVDIIDSCAFSLHSCHPRFHTATDTAAARLLESCLRALTNLTNHHAAACNAIAATCVLRPPTPSCPRASASSGAVHALLTLFARHPAAAPYHAGNVANALIGAGNFDLLVHVLGALVNLAEHSPVARNDICSASTSLLGSQPMEGEPPPTALSSLSGVCVQRAVRGLPDAITSVCRGSPADASTADSASVDAASATAEAHPEDVLIAAYIALLLVCCMIDSSAMLQARILDAVALAMQPVMEGSSVSKPSHAHAALLLRYILGAFFLLQDRAGVLTEDARGHLAAALDLLSRVKPSDSHAPERIDTCGSATPAASSTTAQAKGSPSRTAPSADLGQSGMIAGARPARDWDAWVRNQTSPGHDGTMSPASPGAVGGMPGGKVDEPMALTSSPLRPSTKHLSAIPRSSIEPDVQLVSAPRARTPKRVTASPGIRSPPSASRPSPSPPLSPYIYQIEDAPASRPHEPGAGAKEPAVSRGRPKSTAGITPHSASTSPSREHRASWHPATGVWTRGTDSAGTSPQLTVSSARPVRSYGKRATATSSTGKSSSSSSMPTGDASAASSSWDF